MAPMKSWLFNGLQGPFQSHRFQASLLSSPKHPVLYTIQPSCNTYYSLNMEALPSFYNFGRVFPLLNVLSHQCVG